MAENKKENFFKKLKLNKPKKIKNQAFLKRGSFSLAITAAVIVAAIVVNILVGALNDRFVLEYDMTAEKNNSISIEKFKSLALNKKAVSHIKLLAAYRIVV